MEQIIDCIKKRDWVGCRFAVGLALLASVRALTKALGLSLAVLSLSILAGAGLFVGMSGAIKYQQIITGTKVVYIMPLEVADCGGNGCG